MRRLVGEKKVSQSLVTTIAGALQDAARGKQRSQVEQYFDPKNADRTYDMVNFLDYYGRKFKFLH